MTADYVVLNRTGDKMPLRGFGCWKIEKDVCADVIYKAIKVGYRHFDGACDYGNEVEVGRGIKKAIDEGIVKREDLFSKFNLYVFFLFLTCYYSCYQIMEHLPQQKECTTCL